MDFESKKAENCFSDAENYEYRIEATGARFIGVLEPMTEQLRINDKLRRPTFIARLTNGAQLKGLLDKNVIKVGFVQAQAVAQKDDFERWLGSLPKTL